MSPEQLILDLLEPCLQQCLRDGKLHYQTALGLKTKTALLTIIRSLIADGGKVEINRLQQ